MNRAVFVVWLVALCPAVGCHPSDDPSAPPPRSDWGVVLHDDEQVNLLETCSRPQPAGLSGEWTPEPTEIARLEQRLPAVLDRALARAILEEDEPRPAPTDYYRQYGGFYREGRRVVYVNGLHRTAVEKEWAAPDWTLSAMGLCDGGLLGFGVVYDVEADAFDAIEFDGRFSGPVRMRWF